jgi:hypothetical protein
MNNTYIFFEQLAEHYMEIEMEEDELIEYGSLEQQIIALEEKLSRVEESIEIRLEAVEKVVGDIDKPPNGAVPEDSQPIKFFNYDFI